MVNTRRIISALAPSAAAAALTLGSAASAEASTGVDLHLEPSTVMNWTNGDIATMVFPITNRGTKKTPGALTFTFKYQEPIEPAPATNGGFRNMKFTKGPTGTTCTINRTTNIAICKVPALAAGKTDNLTFTSRADNAGAKTALTGSFYAEVETTVADDYKGNNIGSGGWVIFPN